MTLTVFAAQRASFSISSGKNARMSAEHLDFVVHNVIPNPTGESVLFSPGGLQIR